MTLTPSFPLVVAPIGTARSIGDRNGNGHKPPPRKFKTIYADPPWQFSNRTGKMAPEHRRLHRYRTMTIEEICGLPVREIADTPAHLYLWCPNALLAWGLQVMEAWGFTYKTNLVWYKIRKDGGADGRGVGFYYRNVTELLLFGVRGHLRTFKPGRRAVNIVCVRKREHSRKPDEFYHLIERCSPAPRLELFARHPRKGWTQWGDEIQRNAHAPRRLVLPYKAKEYRARVELIVTG
ncbi:MAG: S-adenosylmethionine-binding protein [Candidatus Rokubacteria bacterium]|nr:S-adenosylmethionine-binding protein [Candidatus Rokubacteria bacterium]